jgi:tetratricopeptide (TPR) repeat protein
VAELQQLDRRRHDTINDKIRARGGRTIRAGFQSPIKAVRALSVAAAAVLTLAGCETNGMPSLGPQLNAPEPTATLQDPDDVKYFPSDEPVHLATEHFNHGDYGLAERYYQDAVEKAPEDATAWIGLAASYDRIGRFDLADRAYASAIRLVGETTEILNNEGYSYMLRGDLVRARKKLLLAYQQDPNNPTIINNLKLLNGSTRVVHRAANP